MEQTKAEVRQLSPTQAAAHLRSLGFDLGEGPVYRAIRDGSLPATRVGDRKLFVTVEAVERRFITPADESPGDDDIDRHIADLVAAAPTLTDQQRDRLAAIARGGHDAQPSPLQSR